MKVVDNRVEFKQYFFEDLCIGECFVDKQGDLCIKTDDDSCIYTTDKESWDKCTMNKWDDVVPLETVLSIEGVK
jgi:hypothetical protein